MGRGNRLKIDKVWVRIPPGAPSHRGHGARSASRRYFLRGVASHIAEIIALEIDASTFATLSTAAESFRPAEPSRSVLRTLSGLLHE